MGTGAHSPGLKQLGYETEHSLPPIAKVKKGGAMPPLTHTFSWHSSEITFLLPLPGRAVR
jgi:hypothetical protein